ncbi:MAG: hypothetical protein JJ971_03185 [Balneolaceae bacterium]|nr:hypothetical protein [Balneolaceae bacterium]MBO6545376.1 hypothetical protein [Balneolaceae bacterium]MBO6646772.1 hypothetical protein [Balneolaceae bacterium]
MKSLKKIIILTLVLTVPFFACDESSTGGDEMTVIPEVSVSTQGTMNGNQVMISGVTAPQDGWIVIHRSNSNNDGPLVPDIIGKAQVSEGENTSVAIQLEEGVSNNEKLWAMLHIDDGTIGEYEFDGQNGFDGPVIFEEEIVMTSFSISQTDPMITSEDQVNMGNIFVVDVNAAEDGWIVIHASNATNDGPQVPEIIGKAPVMAGTNTGVEISVDSEANVQTGDMLYPMLHFDTGTEGEYEFDGQNGFDGPVLSGTDIVLTSFEVQANMSSLTAEDQMIMNNSMMVDVNSDTDGWVVVHRSNATNDGPQVPEIIGKAHITTGMNTDVEIMFNEGEVVEDGEQLWPMVHYDTGVKGEYEFDGVGVNDQPVITANGILMTSITVMGATPEASVVASDQSSNGTMVTIDEVNTKQIGFIVLHRDNGSNAPVVPDEIGKAQVYLGANSDVEITLNSGETLESGDKVWAMLHIDNGTIGSYEFDGSEGSNDPPVIESENIVMVQFTIQ